MFQSIEAVPAYGKILNSKKAVTEHLDNNLDFRDMTTGQYFNKPQIAELGLKGTIRYGKNLEKVTTFGYGK